MNTKTANQLYKLVGTTVCVVIEDNEHFGLAGRLICEDIDKNLYVVYLPNNVGEFRFMGRRVVDVLADCITLE